VDHPRPAGRAARLAVACAVLSLGTGCVRALPVDPEALGGQAVTSVVVSADGTRITGLHVEQDRTPLALAKIPSVLVDAVIATEDRRFYEHKGVDARGIGRALVNNSRSGRTEGGSTITQQLVKNTIGTNELTLQRKVREASLAVGLEQTLTKDQILERYLNTVYFGQGAYGVGAAIRVYFAKPPEQLTLAEAALLAGLIRSPVSADPIRDAKAAKARRGQVLAGMVAAGVITEEQSAAAGRQALPKQSHRDGSHYPAAYAVTDAVEQLRDDERLGETQLERDDAIFRGGLTIKLTIDLEQQRQAEQAVAAVLTGRHDPSAGVAAVRPGDGAITAMAGGRDFFSRTDPVAKVNLARGGSTGRQGASTFKMFTLVAALEGGILPEELFESGPRVELPRPGGRAWTVTNSDGATRGPITLRVATEQSVNTAFARVVERLGAGDVDAGTAKVLEVAERFGVTGRHGEPMRTGPATTLGASEVDPVQMAAAYAALASRGVYAEPYLVASVKDPAGNVLISNEPQRRSVVSASVASVTTDVLQGVIKNGSGVLAEVGRPAAGKTGTSTEYHDAWFVGYTPDFAAAVWVGVPTGQVSMTPAKGFRTTVTGGTYPARIWSHFTRAALAGTAKRGFGTLDGSLVEIEVDAERGCLPNEWTDAKDKEIRSFVSGTEPTEICTEPAAPVKVVVPDVVGSRTADARATLVAAGLRVRVVSVPRGDLPPGQVVAQSPTADAVAYAGDSVTVSVSATVDTRVAVPNVVGMPGAEAVAVLEGAGFVVQSASQASCNGGAACARRLAANAGLAWSQSAPAGERDEPGTSILVLVEPVAGWQPPEPTPTPTPTPATTPTPPPPPTPTPSPSGVPERSPTVTSLAG
jgi:penicillin-binding protein 1A